jgi:hypothetical protein
MYTKRTKLGQQILTKLTIMILASVLLMSTIAMSNNATTVARLEHGRLSTAPSATTTASKSLDERYVDVNASDYSQQSQDTVDSGVNNNDQSSPLARKNSEQIFILESKDIMFISIVNIYYTDETWGILWGQQSGTYVEFTSMQHSLAINNGVKAYIKNVKIWVKCQGGDKTSDWILFRGDDVGGVIYTRTWDKVEDRPRYNQSGGGSKNAAWIRWQVVLVVEDSNGTTTEMPSYNYEKTIFSE